MAFNGRMHSRNIYKNKKPDFKELASKYENFKRDVSIDNKGRVRLDFKDPAHLKALTWALLKDDFDLDVTMPTNRLIPTVPLRLNYILWIEDLFARKASSSLRGIDLGCGPACIYSLLGAKKNSWSFLATEADASSYGYALNNVQDNNLSSLVKVVQVSLSSTLREVLEEATEDISYDFCMSNPPFFENSLDAWGITKSRSESRPEPKSKSTASDVESIYPGGEVEFVKKVIIDPSLRFRTKVRIYTTMLGKKSSIKILLPYLRDNDVKNVTTTEFCQGNTMRWGIAWSFDRDLKLPESPKQPVNSAPLVLDLNAKDSVQELKSIIEDLLRGLKMKYSEEETGKFKCEMISWSVAAHENTWIHQRRKRRQNREKNSKAEDEDEPTQKRSREDLPSNDACRLDVGNIEDDAGCSKSESAVEPSCADLQNDLDYILEFILNLTNKNSKKALEFIWKDGTSKELMHQVLQYFKNHLNL